MKQYLIHLAGGSVRRVLSLTMQYRDTSLFNATRQKEKEDRKLQITQRNLDRQSAIFDKEVKKLRACQNRLARAQLQMATTVIFRSQYRATYIEIRRHLVRTL